MEYAEGGTLSDKILSYKMNKEKFSTDTILNWIAQVVLGVMLMHSKNILHRDLKSQNLFLTSDGTVKIGDFGISKELPTLSSLAKTSCGTPYFMPPEVCKGEPYGEKIDIWAIGCILYELVFLKKPFESKTLSGVFDKIINKPLESSYEEVDSDIKILLMAMLDKDPSRRPSIWELANTPWIHERINKFVQEKGWQEAVATIFEWEQNSPTETQHEPKTHDGHFFDTGRLDVVTHFIRSDIPLADCKNGWFSTVKNWGSGYDIFKWVLNKLEADEDRARTIWQKMLDYGYISRVDNNPDFETTHAPMYRFYEDRDDLAANMLRPFKGTVFGALDTSVELVKLIEDVYREAIVEVDYATKIIAEQALVSKKYEDYISSVSKLEKVDLNFYSVQEAYWFFLNVYQCMYIHCYLKNLKSHQDEVGESASMFSNLKNFMWRKKQALPFFYWIGGYNFTLEELKHGVLRSNRKKPGAILRTLNVNEARSQFIPDERYDQRILFLCLDLPQVMEHIECFDDPDTMDEKLNFYLKEYLNWKVEFDTFNNEITLPSILETYYSDFGGTDEWILRFIWTWFDNSEYSIEDVLKLQRSKLQIKYNTYT